MPDVTDTMVRISTTRRRLILFAKIAAFVILFGFGFWVFVSMKFLPLSGYAIKISWTSYMKLGIAGGLLFSSPVTFLAIWDVLKKRFRDGGRRSKAEV